jgi:hypothetical protein
MSTTTKPRKYNIPDQMKTGHGLLQSDLTEDNTESDTEYVPARDVKRIFASAKINMDILKSNAVKLGTDNKIKGDVIGKMKKTIDVYKSRYEQANAELETMKGRHKQSSVVITGADLFLKDQTLTVAEEIDREYKKIRSSKMKEYEQYFV